MNYKKVMFLKLLLMLIFVGCKNNNENLQKAEGSEYVISTNTDTIYLNQYFKALAYIEEPIFGKEKNVGLIVYLDCDENISLLEDLSNEREICFELFNSLSYDEYNQKWFDSEKYDFEQTVVFGKKMTSVGEQKLRGYILEYFGGEYDPEKDEVSNNGKMHKQFFEISVYVKDTLN